MSDLLADWLTEQGITAVAPEPAIDLLTIDRRHFFRKPQVGVPERRSWPSLCSLLSEPRSGNQKDAFGAFSPAKYDGNIRRTENLISIGILVVDVDGNGCVDRMARAVAAYDAIVLETFSSTPETPRCRILFRLAEHIDAATYEAAHAPVRAHLRGLDAVTDDGAKDASRLSYWPVRPPGADYAFRIVRGAPLDARRIVAAQPKPSVRLSRDKRPFAIAGKHTSAYVRGALNRAARAISAAAEGARHGTLCREAFCLARLGLTEAEIADTLLPAAVHAMGDARRREAERTIHDAVSARRKGAA